MILVRFAQFPQSSTRFFLNLPGHSPRHSLYRIPAPAKTLHKAAERRTGLNSALTHYTLNVQGYRCLNHAGQLLSRSKLP